MSQEEFKRLLIETLGENSKKGRRWFFPKNVDKEYKIFANMTLKELLIYVLPAFIISIIIAAIPPYSSVLFWIIKCVFILFIIVIPVFYANYRPVSERDNIRTNDLIKEYIQYKNLQKIYFIKPKKKTWEGQRLE